MVSPPWLVRRDRTWHSTGVLIATPATTTCPLVRAGSSSSRSRPAPSTELAMVCWSMGFTIFMMNWVMHWESTSLSSLPGRWVMRPTPTPNLRPSARMVLRMGVLTTVAPAGAKRWASSSSTKTG
ncbi:hypothetical protein D3C87_1500190 [compost metagenome]